MSATARLYPNVAAGLAKHRPFAHYGVSMADDERDLPAPRRCGSYTPGHEVHYIQARKAREDQEHPSIPVRVVDIDDVAVTVVLDERTIRDQLQRR